MGMMDLLCSTYSNASDDDDEEQHETLPPPPRKRAKRHKPACPLPRPESALNPQREAPIPGRCISRRERPVSDMVPMNPPDPTSNAPAITSPGSQQHHQHETLPPPPPKRAKRHKSTCPLPRPGAVFRPESSLNPQLEAPVPGRCMSGRERPVSDMVPMTPDPTSNTPATTSPGMTRRPRTDKVRPAPLPEADWSGWDLEWRPPMGPDGKPVGWPKDICYVDVWQLPLGHPPHQLLPRQVKSKKKTTRRGGQNSKQVRARKATKCKYIADWTSKCKIQELVDGVPLGPVGYEKLASYVGMQVRNRKFAPQCVINWKHLPYTYKSRILQRVKEKFDFGTGSVAQLIDKKVMKMIHGRWLDSRHNLRTDHYYFYKTEAEIMENRPSNELCNELEWRWLVRWWNSKAFQGLANQNIANRAEKKVNHTAGRRPYVLHKQDLATDMGIAITEVRRCQTWKVVHVKGRKNKRSRKTDLESNQYPNEETRVAVEEVYETAMTLLNSEQGLDDIAEGAIFTQKLGPEGRGRTRGYGFLGPTPSSLNLCTGGSSRSPLTQQLEEERRQRDELAAKVVEIEEKSALDKAELEAKMEATMAAAKAEMQAQMEAEREKASAEVLIMRDMLQQVLSRLPPTSPAGLPSAFNRFNSN